MRALYATGRTERPLEWREADAPSLEAETDALVRPIAVAACDLDRAIVSGRSPFPGAFPLGHEFTGTVLEVGEAVTAVRPGDTVLASFQPSCGTCPRCERGASSVCAAVPNGSMYGIGAAGGDFPGAIADAIRVPWADYTLAPLTASLDPVAVASASDNLADGLRGVDGPLARRPGASVLVAGRGSIPLYAVLCARHLGAGAITVASDDPFLLATAEAHGADCLETTNWPKRFASHDVTVDCTNSLSGIAAVLRSTEPYGESTSSSIFFGKDVPVPMFNLNMRGISFHTGRVNSAAQISRVLELLGEGLDPAAIDPAVHGFDAAIDALAGEPFSRKVILEQERGTASGT